MTDNFDPRFSAAPGPAGSDAPTAQYQTNSPYQPISGYQPDGSYQTNAPYRPASPHRSSRRAGRTAAVATALVLALASAGVSGYALHEVLDQPAAANAVSDPGSRAVVAVENTSWTAVAEQVSDSVVAITVSSRGGNSQGSGVIISAEGHILTNNHVVSAAAGRGSGAQSLTVTLTDGRIFSAEVIGTDASSDLAVIQLEEGPEDLSVASFGDSAAVAVGDPVMAVGNPLGLANTVTTGIVSAVQRPVSVNSESQFGQTVVTNAIQVDAAVNPGNSGGPLFNAAGQVVGINSSIATTSSSAGSIGLGFAIPSNLAKRVASELIQSGEASMAYLGAYLSDATAEVAGQFYTGTKIERVVDGAPAAAELEVGDIITQINGSPIADSEAAIAAIREQTPGATVDLKIVRNNFEKTLKLRLGAAD